MVDVIEYLQETYLGRNRLLSIINSFTETISKYQDQTGLGWQVLDKANKEGNYLESTASTMFVYSLIKAVKNGYIDKMYQSVALEGYNGILKHFIKIENNGNISITMCCAGTGLEGNPYRDGSYEYYVYIESIVPNDGKGVGPFIMSCVEIEKMKTMEKSSRIF